MTWMLRSKSKRYVSKTTKSTMLDTAWSAHELIQAWMQLGNRVIRQTRLESKAFSTEHMSKISIQLLIVWPKT
jgi:hypothetical protein